MKFPPPPAVHVSQSRRCLRGCRPRVTRTPSRVQAAAQSNTARVRSGDRGGGTETPSGCLGAKAQKCTPWKYAIRSRSYYLTKKPAHSFVTAVDKKPMLLMHNLDIGRGMLTVIAFSCSLRGRNQSQSCCKPSLGRQAPARRRTLIPSTLLRGTPRAAALRSFYILV